MVEEVEHTIYTWLQPYLANLWTEDLFIRKRKQENRVVSFYLLNTNEKTTIYLYLTFMKICLSYNKESFTQAQATSHYSK